MAEITQSLFGITPESYQQAQNQALQAEALKFAQLDPMQQAQMGAYMAGSRIGTGIGGLLGAEDPTLKLIKQRQELLRGGDLTSVQGYNDLAAKLFAAGDTLGAQEALNKGAALGKTYAETQAKQAEAAAKMSEKLTPEQKNAAALADSSGVERGTPEWTAAYNKNLTALTTKKEGTSEAERIIDSLPLNDAQKQQLKQQRLTALLNPESNMLKGLDAQLKVLQAQMLNRQMANLPDSAIKYEEEDVAKIDALGSLTETIKKPIDYLTPDKKTGISKLDLSPKKILDYNIKNASGNSDEQSLMYADLKQAVAQATNIKTDAAKGVQTDRDVLRFANELVAAFASNDTKAMLRSLTNMKDAQEREQRKLKERVNSRRSSYQIAPRYVSDSAAKAQGTVDNPIILK